jgi:hypothetical protein
MSSIVRPRRPGVALYVVRGVDQKRDEVEQRPLAVGITAVDDAKLAIGDPECFLATFEAWLRRRGLPGARRRRRDCAGGLAAARERCRARGPRPRRPPGREADDVDAHPAGCPASGGAGGSVSGYQLTR